MLLLLSGLRRIVLRGALVSTSSWKVLGDRVARRRKPAAGYGMLPRPPNGSLPLFHPPPHLADGLRMEQHMCTAGAATLRWARNFLLDHEQVHNSRI